MLNLKIEAHVARFLGLQPPDGNAAASYGDEGRELVMTSNWPAAELYPGDTYRPTVHKKKELRGNPYEEIELETQNGAEEQGNVERE